MSDELATKDSERSIAGGDPLAICTLPPDSLAERLAWIRREILPHAIATEWIAGGVAFELTDADGLAAKLDRLVALERDCCSSVVFEHTASATPGQRRLEVRGLPPDFAGFGALPVASSPRSRLGTRIAQAAGSDQPNGEPPRSRR